MSKLQQAYDDITRRLTEERSTQDLQMDVDAWSAGIFVGWQLFSAPTTLMFLDSLFNNLAWSVLVTVIIVLSQAGWYTIARKSSGTPQRAGIGWGMAGTNLMLDALFTAGYLSTFQAVYQVLPDDALPYVLWSLSIAGALNVAALMVHAAMSPEGKAQRKAAQQREAVETLKHNQIIAEHKLELARITAEMTAILNEADEIVSTPQPRRPLAIAAESDLNPTTPRTGQTVTPEAVTPGMAWRNGTK